MSDTRETIGVNDTFNQMVRELFESKTVASILYENNGVTRANGLITELVERDGKLVLTLEDGTTIDTTTLHAVNGTFSADYSEC